MRKIESTTEEDRKAITEDMITVADKMALADLQNKKFLDRLGIGRMEMSDADAALHYAVMDLNKRGGGSDLKSAAHIEEYCKYYQNFIKREIEIINPDVVVWLGTKTYDMELHSKYLDAECEKDKRYFIIDHKKVPILRMWHTSYYRGHIEPLPGYSNRIVGKLCAKCLEELEKYNICLF